MANVEFKETDRFSTKKAFISLTNIDRRTARGIRQGFFKLGQALQSKSSSNILDKSQKSGLVYIRVDSAGRRRRHRSSAAGETHANMTGKLRRARGWKVKGAESLTFQYGADGRVPPPYDGAIEFGRKDGSIEARPSLRNTIEELDKDAENYFEEDIIKEIEK